MKRQLALLLCLLLTGCTTTPSQPEDTPTQNQDYSMSSLDEEKDMFINVVPVSDSRKRFVFEWLNQLAKTELKPYKDYIELKEGRTVFTEKGKTLPNYVNRYSLTIGDKSLHLIRIENQFVLVGLDCLYLANEKDIQSIVDAFNHDVSETETLKFYTDSLSVPEDTYVTQQYLLKNLPDITQDLLFVERGAYKDVLPFNKEDAPLKNLLVGVEADLLKEDRVTALLKIIPPLESISAGEDYSEATADFIINNENVTLDYPTPFYSKFYSKNEVASLYEKIYGEPLNASLYISSNPAPNTVRQETRYDESNELFIFYDFRDNVVAKCTYPQLYVVEKSIQNNQLHLQLAFIKTEFNLLLIEENLPSTIIYKNSGLPIQKQHFSKQSQQDGIYAISEIIQDQPDQFDTYEVIANINENGSYTLVSCTQTNQPFIPEDNIIFYNVFEKANPHSGNDMFLALFNCSLCETYNEKILSSYYYPSSSPYSYSFYEDDEIAVVLARKSVFPGTTIRSYPYDMNIYAFDKVNQKVWPYLNEKDAQYYRSMLKEAGYVLPNDIQIQKIKIMNQTLIQFQFRNNNYVMEVVKK